MRVPALPIIASFALLAAPAFAQSSATPGTTNPATGAETTGNTTGSGTMGQTAVPGPSTAWDHGSASEQSGASNPSAAWQHGSAMEQSGVSNPSTGWHRGASVTTDTRQKIAQSLEQSGFKDISVTPEAFVIHAQAPDGSHVVMLLRPDQVTGVVEQTGSSSPPNGAMSEPNGTPPNGTTSSGSGASH